MLTQLIQFPATRPSRAIVPVEMVFSASLSAIWFMRWSGESDAPEEISSFRITFHCFAAASSAALPALPATSTSMAPEAAPANRSGAGSLPTSKR